MHCISKTQSWADATPEEIAAVIKILDQATECMFCFEPADYLESVRHLAQRDIEYVTLRYQELAELENAGLYNGDADSERVALAWIGGLRQMYVLKRIVKEIGTEPRHCDELSWQETLDTLSKRIRLVLNGEGLL